MRTLQPISIVSAPASEKARTTSSAVATPRRAPKDAARGGSSFANTPRNMAPNGRHQAHRRVGMRSK